MSGPSAKEKNVSRTKIADGPRHRQQDQANDAVVVTPANGADNEALADLLHGGWTRVWGDQVSRTTVICSTAAHHSFNGGLQEWWAAALPRLRSRRPGAGVAGEQQPFVSNPTMPQPFLPKSIPRTAICVVCSRQISRARTNCPRADNMYVLMYVLDVLGVEEGCHPIKIIRPAARAVRTTPAVDRRRSRDNPPRHNRDFSGRPWGGPCARPRRFVRRARFARPRRRLRRERLTV